MLLSILGFVKLYRLVFSSKKHYYKQIISNFGLNAAFPHILLNISTANCATQLQVIPTYSNYFENISKSSE